MIKTVKNLLTDTMAQALQMMVTQPAYMADGTKVPDTTGKALRRRGLARWSDEQQAWVATVRAYDCRYGAMIVPV